MSVFPARTRKVNVYNSVALRPPTSTLFPYTTLFRSVASDALRVIPLLPGRFDFAFIDAAKEDYLDYLRQLEPKLVPGAVVVADNTGYFRRDVAPYLEHVRTGGRYDSRGYDFDDDAMEVSVLRR